MQPAGGQAYRFNRGVQQGVPTASCSTRSCFWEAFAPAAGTLALHDLACQPGSPGRLFKIDESSFSDRLEGIEKQTGAPCRTGNGGPAAAIPPTAARPERGPVRGLCRWRAAAMSDPTTLDKLVIVSPRFVVVALVRDAHRTDALDGYILTPTGRDVLHRLAAASGTNCSPGHGR